ncbi:hypothetical protein JCM5350_000146 [Sporobolomyces pararoseus]
MSFSSLPPELVHQIIESTVPHTFHTTTYKDRQDTLCRLSLVSRQFRSIAQPLLLEIARIKNDTQLNIIQRNGAKVVSRELVLSFDGDLSSDSVDESLRLAQKLSSLTIRNTCDKIIDLGVLSSCTNLVNLQLSGRVSVATTLNQLPSLQSLSVDWQTLKTVPQILDPQKLPGLRILGLITVDDEYDWENLQKTSILKLLPQLQALHLDVDLLQFSQGTSFSELAPPTLFDASVIRRLGPANVARVSTIQDLRLNVQYRLRKHGKVDTLNAISLYVKSYQTLRSIYLDPEVQPVESDDKETYDEFGKLVQKCREAGIDLVFESPPMHYGIDTYVSPEFYRMQRKSKEEEEKIER